MATLIQIVYVVLTLTIHANDYTNMSVFSAEGNFVCFFDRCFYVPELLDNGLFYRCVLSHFSSISLALIGTAFSIWFYNVERNGKEKAGIVLIGILLVVSALGLHQFIPMNKRLWSSSFILMAAGIDIIILVLLNIIFDKRAFKHMYLFESLGQNTIAMYMLRRSGAFMQLGAFILSIPFIIFNLQGDFYNQLAEFIVILAVSVFLANKKVKINV
ncbi:MAG: hypothetical protein IJT81_08725 [Lachnospiraceae bacterium]|nr:hypothetical protein [Lachnospiraceae bacterium]